MTITYHHDLQQGTEEWLAARRGILTASEVKLIMTPGGKAANNDKTRAHVYELLAQRISGYVEPRFQSFDMEQGHIGEIYARQVYHEQVAETQECGFVTNDRWGFTLGYSPDWLVGDDGQAECKTRCQKYQVQTIIEHVAIGKSLTIPADYVLQCQTGLMVTERKWLDFVSYHGGLPMVIIRVWPDPKIQEAIIEAATAFEAQIAEKWQLYRDAEWTDGARLIETERMETETPAWAA